ncbi:DUF58 domain-containing protein [soil metagenome]
MPESTALLDSETISQAQALGLHARYIVEGYMSGEHKSPFRGFSVEFTQHREYVPGDDTRHLDWKVLGRTDRYYVKQYEQETNYVAHLLVDASESMAYGSGRVTKLAYAQQLAACIAYLVLLQRDAVSMSVFDSSVRQFLPRTGKLASIHNLMTSLAAMRATAQTDVAAVLHRMAATTPRRGIFILISDLFDDEQKILDAVQHLRFGGHEVIVFHTLDPCEIEFPFQGMVEFEGLEIPAKLLTRPAEIRKSYRREVQAFMTRIRELCERNRSHYVLANTSQPLHEMLSGYLAFRARTRTK